MNDKASPLYWFDKPLSYTPHSQARCYLRYVPFLDYLPLNAKFESLQNQGKRFCFTYHNSIGKVRVVISEPGIVITTYYLMTPTRSKVKFEKRSYIPDRNDLKYPHREVFEAMYEYA
jgi:hypothetical protein